MTFALGLASFYMWQGLSLGWWGVPVDLPEARSGSVLEVTVPVEKKPSGPKYLCDEFAEGVERDSCLDQVVFEGRDMSPYDEGGRQGCGREERNTAPSKCERSMEKARRFIADHWKKRKRGYIAVANTSDKAEWVTHLFIEPAKNGSWRMYERTVPMLREPEDPEHYSLGALIELEWYRATADDVRHGLTPGTLYLKLNNITGNSLML